MNLRGFGLGVAAVVCATNICANELSPIAARSLLEQITDHTIWYGTEFTDPPGGYIFRFPLDVDGDGIDEWFLGSSLDSDRSDTAWRVFRREADGVWKETAAEIMLSPEGFYAQRDPQGLLQIATFASLPFDHAEVRRVIFNTALGYTTFTERISDLDLLPDNTADAHWPLLAARYKLGIFQIPRVEKILLAQWIRHPESQWRPYDHDAFAHEQWKDPSDQTEINRLSTSNPFTPAELSQAVKNAIPARPHGGSRSEVQTSHSGSAFEGKWYRPLRWATASVILTAIVLLFWRSVKHTE